MTYLNSFTDFFVGSLLRQFTGPWPGLVAAALVTSMAMLLVIRWVSSPAAIRRAKDRLIARVLELVLFRHDARVSFTAGGRILAANLGYLRTLLWPLAFSAVPCILILTQLSCWYAWRPFKARQAALSVKLRDGFPVLEQSVSLSVPTCVRQRQRCAFWPAKSAWRLRAERRGRLVDIVMVAGELVEAACRRSLCKSLAATIEPRDLESLLYPAEPPIDKASSIVDVDVRYPLRIMYLGNMEVDWVLAFVILTMIFGLLLKRPLRVQF